MLSSRAGGRAGCADAGEGAMPDSSRSLELANYILDAGFGGPGPLKSSVELAHEYLNDAKYQNHNARIRSLIQWEASKNFTTGFVTGLGGLVTMPVSVPSAVGAAWLIQARMVGAIATIDGYDITDDRVRTLALISIAGDSGKEVLKRAGIDLSQRAGKAALAKLPGRVLIDINKRVGFRLLTKGGTRGVINLWRVVPVLGGAVGGSVDAAMCVAVGRAAARNFPPRL